MRTLFHRSNMKRNILALICVIALLGSQAPVWAAASEDETRLRKITTQLSQGESTILEAAKKMLQHKLGQGSEPEDQWARWGEPLSNLTIDRTGGLALLGGGSSEVMEGVDLLTGQKAIETSLQLGNIGSDADGNRQLLRGVRDALEQYILETQGNVHFESKKYPESLEVFRSFEDEWWANAWINESQKNIADVANLVIYSAQGNRYTLAVKPAVADIDIAEVNPVETPSHDYETMIAEENISFEVPDIASVVPADMFFAYFSNTEDYEALVQAIDAPAQEILNFLPLPTATQLEEKVSKRLGIPDPKKFLGFISEIAFVSEDLNFTTQTDFAVIVKWKSGGIGSIASMLESGENVFGEVGEYFVFATHQSVMNHISSAHRGDVPQLSEEKDYHYALGVLEKRREGNAVFF